MHILITGASGYLGGNILKKLVSETVYNVSLISSRPAELLKEYPNIKTFNYSDLQSKVIDFTSIDLIINCAFSRTSDPHELAKSLDFTTNLVTQASINSDLSFINISSQSVYDNERMIAARETDLVKPQTHYAIAKYATEKIVEAGFQNTKNSYTNIRLASLSGVGFDHRLTSRLVKSVIEGDPIKINGGEQKISYLSGDDAAKSIISIIKSNSNKWRSVYNLGVEESYSLREIATILNEISKELNYVANINIEQSDDFMNNSMDNSMLKSDFNIKNNWDLNKDLKEIFERKQRGS